MGAKVLIGGLGVRGLCGGLLGLCLGKPGITASAPLLQEVSDKLATKIKLPHETVEEIISFLERHTSNVQPADVPADACRDPDDLMVLGTAKASGASYLITGDRDLLTLDSYNDIRIVTPRQFWETQSQASP